MWIVDCCVLCIVNVMSFCLTLAAGQNPLEQIKYFYYFIEVHELSYRHLVTDTQPSVSYFSLCRNLVVSPSANPSIYFKDQPPVSILLEAVDSAYM